MNTQGFELRGATCVVTGGASGIGAALIAEVVRRGAAAVAVVDIDGQRAADAAARLGSAGVDAAGFACDVSDVASVGHMAQGVCERFGTPTFVAANAGVFPPAGPAWELDPADVAWTLGVNVTGVWLTTSVFAKLMVASDRPSWILGTGSEHALGVPHTGSAIYTASKHAVVGLLDVMRSELPSHVGVSVMCPGLVATNLWKGAADRPDQFGGPTRISRRAGVIMTHGMDPALVAERAIDGVQAGQFLVATHRHVQQYADERYAEVERAFASLGADDGSEQAYDVASVAAVVNAEDPRRTAG
ncbi:MAG: SDR family NAD(P)-dependent oxidoreductase [Actinobacteria bacterium]|uniref:Unannotated protein n=1 Tax=freshwater metagenome TaxID=449393 RepID=A0A6J7IDI0_9ZZZZ|nr:SDR family NAD(P)-dependent oxidoreductase [Actinomycetota bacterium]MSW77348.1 SDR family NAD(P)-dependent oxidoreductase [Actinomycetota bacterium]MSX93620.1 SDR family NAD(P)-dependent oxidoreductase [Actinomycetota bacterium]MSZ82721.1 SDR family NAD(P)-dependent oxidoreductase [Actinomycetota bacterium]MTB17623.1 SDR family NAD(P)-dependent oxidoreductase [Actinomycetota bacterium]